MLAATDHDKWPVSDYRRLAEFDITTVREGLRWHLIEPFRGHYDFSSITGLLDAAAECGVEQIIDLFHFGWPEHVDVFQEDFVQSFAELGLRFARLLKTRGVVSPLIAPMNEISFVSWAGGDVAYLNPFQRGRGAELKRQLVRAGVCAAEAFLSELPETRLVWPEPVIHIAGDPNIAGDQERAEAYRLSMFEAWDMLLGRSEPELGGFEGAISMIGVNFYERNQRMNSGRTLLPGDPEFRPFHQILLEVWKRYRRPLFVSETGTEDEYRAAWFSYIASEVERAKQLGVPVEGICLYPVVNHPGWDDDRHCQNGLLDYPDAQGYRQVYKPLAEELQRRQMLNSQS